MVDTSSSCAVGDVLEDHRPQFRLVAVLEIFLLVVQNGSHRTHKRIVALFDGRDEPFGGVNLVLHELDRLLVLSADKAVGTAPFSADHVHIAAVDAHINALYELSGQLEMPAVLDSRG